MHGRADDYSELKPADVAYYDGCIEVDLSAIEPMIALPFHPSNAYTIDELNANLEDILHAAETEARRAGRRGQDAPSACSTRLRRRQAARGAGRHRRLRRRHVRHRLAGGRVLKGANTGCGEFSLSVYPTSQPVALELVHATGCIGDLWAGAIVRTASAAPASARATRPPTTACPSATPPATSPTARAPSRAMAS